MLALLTPLAADVLDFQRQGNIAPYLAVFVFGMLVGVAGHIWASRELVVAGILIAGVSAVMPWVVWS